MIKAKTHKAKSDKETIIDMEPVNETQKTIILKNPIFFNIIYNCLFIYYNFDLVNIILFAKSY